MGRPKHQPCNCGAKLFNAGATEQGFRVMCSKCKKRWTADKPVPKRPPALTRTSHGPCGCTPLSARVIPWTFGRVHLRCRRCKRSWIADSEPENNAPGRKPWGRRPPKPERPVVIAPEPAQPQPEPPPEPAPTPPPIARPFSADKPYDDRLITVVKIAAGTPLGVELEEAHYVRYREICKAPREDAVITYSPKEAAR